ncbi:hypothetical protein ACA910_010718 [Epithemia clementina (nom. ined.)]
MTGCNPSTTRQLLAWLLLSNGVLAAAYYGRQHYRCRHSRTFGCDKASINSAALFRRTDLSICTTTIPRGGGGGGGGGAPNTGPGIETAASPKEDPSIQKRSAKESQKKKKKAKKTTTATKKGSDLTEEKVEKKKTKKTKTSPSSAAGGSSDDGRESKKKIEQVLKTDPAEGLGDAIRERAEQLLTGNNNRPNREHYSFLDQMDDTFRSVGWALGSSDQLTSLLTSSSRNKKRHVADNDDSNNHHHHHLEGMETGNVEASTTSVFVHYFMRSHGGAHAVQSVCSLLAALTGIGAILSPIVSVSMSADVLSTTTQKSPVVSEATLALIGRCLVFAMMKHISGMLATGALVARAIPEVGLRNARLWIRDLVHDPIAQYVFYCACVFFWLPASSNKSVSSEQQLQLQPQRWWQAYAIVPLCLVGPVVLREVINIIYVLSDLLVLWKCTNQNNNNDEDDENAKKSISTMALERVINYSKAFVDAFMSILVTSQVWRSADAMQRQAILAKLVGRISLAGEVLVGILMLLDSVSLLFFALYRTNKSAGANSYYSLVVTIVKSFLCTQLYLRFLLVRRRKITRLATKIRGGAARLPFYVLDVLLDPASAMGLTFDQATTRPYNATRTWKDWVLTSLGLDEDFPKNEHLR